MSWNYRVIRKTRSVRVGNRWRIIHHYDIHEVYYDEKGNPKSWTLEPISANGVESKRDLLLILTMMATDVRRLPVLEIVGKDKKRLVNRAMRKEGE